MKRICGIYVAIAMAALLAGCGGTANQPVSEAGLTALPNTTAPTHPSASLFPTPTQSPEPTLVPASPVPYSWPVYSASLFQPSPVPDDFSSPLYLSGDGQMFLYATADDKIFKAMWNGTGYTSVPSAENVTAGTAAKVYVDAKEQILFCQGSKLYPDGKTGPAIVMVNLKDGSRCNLDEYASWKEEGFTLTGDFQYYGGWVLAQMQVLQDEKYSPVNKWALFDIAGKSYSVLDMTTFKAKNLSDWHDMVTIKLTLAGNNSVLALCLVHGATATGATATPDAADTYGLLTFMLDSNGAVIKSGSTVETITRPEKLAIWQGTLLSTSPDGKYLLYSATPKASGLFLYDIGKNEEHTIVTSSSAGITFAQWGRDGSIYYGAASAQGHGDIAIFKTTVAAVESRE